jgi:hypothetical protein
VSIEVVRQTEPSTNWSGATQLSPQRVGDPPLLVLDEIALVCLIAGHAPSLIVAIAPVIVR